MRSASASAVLLWLCCAATADTAVTRDGLVLRGELVLTGEALTAKRTQVPRDDLYLVERDDGALVWAPDFEGRLRGYEYLGRHERREALAARKPRILLGSGGVADRV